MGKAKKAIIVVILVALVGGYYFYLSNYNGKEEETVVTAVQDVLLKNLDDDYPPTPREVLKYYSDITKCLYNEEYTESQLEQMADKLLALFDTELAENNHELFGFKKHGCGGVHRGRTQVRTDVLHLFCKVRGELCILKAGVYTEKRDRDRPLENPWI